MEWLAIALAAVLTGLSPAGLVLDQVVALRIRAQVEEIEQLAVRIDNVPSDQIIGGKVDRVRIASRGVYPIDGVRIETIELESDPLDVNLQRLTKGGKNAITESLRQPAQVALKIVIKETDINQALEFPKIKSQLQKLVNSLVPNRDELQLQFDLSSIRIEFLPSNRIRTEIQLQRVGNEFRTPVGNKENEQEATQPLDVVLEAGLNVISGRTLQITEPTGSINGRKLSTRLLKGFAEGLNQQLDLRQLEKDNLIARILQLNITDEEITLASFIRVNPKPTTGNTQP